MDAGNEAGAARRTTVKRQSERELVVTRHFEGPPRLVFEAWTTPDLLKRWWVPVSTGMSFVACELDVRTGGSYRFVFSHPAAPEPAAFFGKYLEVTPPSRLVWTNEESDEGAISTATFEEQGGRTLFTLREVYPTRDALDAAIAAWEDGMPEQYDQLDDLLAALGSNA